MNVSRFEEDGFVRVDGAFPRALADQVRALLWTLTGCSEHDRSTWTKPVVRLGMLRQPAMLEAAATPALRAAYDALVGEGAWLPVGAMGTFPVRFPSSTDAGDTGWHVDVSFGFENEPDFMKWRVNARSKGRALLMLFLFSDVGEDDAPTRIRVGSHRVIASQLAGAGEEGLMLRELDFAASDGCREVLATGAAGTVYLCHPFIVHAAQRHRGERVKFMAQPPLLPRGELSLDSPVMRAVR